MARTRSAFCLQARSILLLFVWSLICWIWIWIHGRILRRLLLLLYRT